MHVNTNDATSSDISHTERQKAHDYTYMRCLNFSGSEVNNRIVVARG